MWIQLVELGLLGLDFAYHKWFEDHPRGARAEQDISLPQSGEGSPVPLIFGKCRVRQPVLAWTSAPTVEVPTLWTGPPVYRMSMLFNAGIPMADSVGVCGLYDTFIGETRGGNGGSFVNIVS